MVMETENVLENYSERVIMCLTFERVYKNGLKMDFGQAIVSKNNF
jgi:hypothetical protein